MGASHSKAKSATLEQKLRGRVNSSKVPNKQSSFSSGIEADGDLRLGPHQADVAISKTEEWEKQLLKDPKNRLALSALANHDATKILSPRSAHIENIQKFNITIPLEGSPVTNQRSSGRCWLFAATNVFRVAYIKKYNLKEFELSQAYLHFWDKLEKANYFLEQILDTKNEDLDGRLIRTLLTDPVSDGGQWDMLVNLVAKYGLVPQTQYPDSFYSKNSAIMNKLITTKLREDALTLRKLASANSEKIGAVKEKMVQEIHLILTLMLGPPPQPNKSFTWEYYDKSDKFHSLTTTPKDFSQLLSSNEGLRPTAGTDPTQLFSLVNDPRNEYGQLLSVSRLGNVIEGQGITYVNVEMSTIKTACISMLRAGIPVFFGSDVGKFADRSSGILDTALVDYELGFNVRLGMSKMQRLQSGESAMTHAMVITAVHIIDEKPTRWRIENSWGTDPGSNGYFVMSDAWMDEFVYQAVVDPKFVDKSILDVLKQQPKVLPLWDPMGALA